MLRTLSFNHKSVDINFGEYFINIQLAKKLLLYLAIDLTQFRSDISWEFPKLLSGLGKSKRIFGCWERTWMGLKSSPEIAARAYYLAEELVCRKETDPTNLFFWDQVVINAIGQDDFNLVLPWVF